MPQNQIINLLENTFQTAATLTTGTTNSSPVDISGAQTIAINCSATVASAVSMTVAFQVSTDILDSTKWTTKGSVATVTATDNVLFTDYFPEYKYVRLKFVVASGSVVVTSTALGKGP